MNLYFIRYTILVCLLSSLYSFSNAKTYYISSKGNDQNSGTNENQPWKTLDKINKNNLLPGDQVLFLRGDEWHGKIEIKNSGTPDNPIIFGAYGSGEKPVIYGSEEISGWSLYSENVYKTSVSAPIEQLFIDGIRARVARYPDRGYIYIDSKLTETQFSSTELDGNIDYTGAKWYGRTIYWDGVLRDIVSSSFQTLTINKEPEGKLGKDEGFFLMNKLEFLTENGEWYYDASEKVLYVLMEDSPINHKVTGSIYSNGFVLTNVNYITVNNFDVREQSENGFYLHSNKGITLDSNEISYPEKYGISAEGNTYKITNNIIRNANAGGMWIWGANSLISNNIIDKTAVFIEIGLKGTTAPNGGSGAEISGDNNIIEYNVIENSNYNGLFFRGKSEIRFNFINNSCLYKDDGGGIYTGTHGSLAKIHHNVITNSIGNPEGYTSTRSLAEGIYIDEVAQDVIVEFNTIQNVGNSGIKLHNIGGIQVNNNTIFNARYGFFCDLYVGAPSIIENNIVYMISNENDYEPRPLFVRVGTYNSKFDLNDYVNPYLNFTSKTFKSTGPFDFFDFTQWQEETNQDIHSTLIDIKLNSEEKEKLFYNISKEIKSYNLNGASARDIYGNVISDTFVLQPYTSKILIGENLDGITEILTETSMQSFKTIFHCYPNPFKDQINIYVPDNTGDISIDVIGISGYFVKNIHRGLVNNNQNFISWDGCDNKGAEVSSGFYFIRFVSKDIIKTNKVLKLN